MLQATLGWYKSNLLRVIEFNSMVVYTVVYDSSVTNEFCFRMPKTFISTKKDDGNLIVFFFVIC